MIYHCWTVIYHCSQQWYHCWQWYIIVTNDFATMISLLTVIQKMHQSYVNHLRQNFRTRAETLISGPEEWNTYISHLQFRSSDPTQCHASKVLDTIIYSNTLPTEGITAGLVAPFWLVSVFYRERRHGHNTFEPTLPKLIRYSETLKRDDGSWSQRRRYRRTLPCSSIAESKLGSKTNGSFRNCARVYKNSQLIMERWGFTTPWFRK